MDISISFSAKIPSINEYTKKPHNNYYYKKKKIRKIKKKKYIIERTNKINLCLVPKPENIVCHYYAK